MQNFISLITVL